MFVKMCKLFVGIFLLYSTWYSQVWGANQLILYLSVGVSIVFMMLDAVLVLKRLNIGKINPIVKMYIIFGAYAILTGIVVSVDKGELLSSAFTYISFTMVAFEVWYISFRTKNSKWILDYIYALALLCAVTTIFFGQDYLTEVVVTTMSEYNNPNTLGVLMFVGIFTVVFQKETLEKHFILKYSSIFIFLYVILLSGSRKAFFAGIGLFLLWVVEYLKEKKKEKTTLKTVIIIAIIILSIIGALGYMLNVYVGMSGFERLLLLFEEDGTSERIHLMRYAVQYWKQSPIFGIGLDQFKILNPREYYSHSTYAEILSCTGIMGCLLFFMPLLKLLIVSMKKALRKSDSGYKMRICLLMLCMELFLGIVQIFIYSITHLIVLLFIANIVYEEISCEDRGRKHLFRFKR